MFEKIKSKNPVPQAYKHPGTTQGTRVPGGTVTLGTVTFKFPVPARKEDGNHDISCQLPAAPAPGNSRKNFPGNSKEPSKETKSYKSMTGKIH
eukprot:182842-Rhodomonas_salina.2